MRFTTPVEVGLAPFVLKPSSQTLFLGSCFADNIGKRLGEILPTSQTLINPFGTLYDHRSLANALQWLCEDAPLADELFFEGTDGLWRSWGHAGNFVAATFEACRGQVDAAMQQARAFLRNADAIFVTLSSAHYYVPIGLPDGVAANCHKQPAKLFQLATDALSTMTARWKSVLHTFRQCFPATNVVFTLSPYRYQKYGFHTSQIDKAKLLLLIDELQSGDDSVAYFPAYEVVMDELRDYRFYKSDMLHPSEQAIDYLASRFGEWCFSEELSRFAQERIALLRDRQHRPLHPESAAHQAFLEKLEQREQLFREKWGVPII